MANGVQVPSNYKGNGHLSSIILKTSILLIGSTIYEIGFTSHWKILRILEKIVGLAINYSTFRFSKKIPNAQR